MLNHYGIIVDIRRRRLIEPNTGLSSNGYLKLSDVASVGILNRECRFSEIDARFPEVTGSKPALPITSRDVLHHIETSGPPVAERTRHLDPEKYRIAQAEFEELVKQGICSQSKSP